MLDLTPVETPDIRDEPLGEEIDFVELVSVAGMKLWSRVPYRKSGCMTEIGTLSFSVRRRQSTASHHRRCRQCRKKSRER